MSFEAQRGTVSVKRSVQMSGEYLTISATGEYDDASDQTLEVALENLDSRLKRELAGGEADS